MSEETTTQEKQEEKKDKAVDAILAELEKDQKQKNRGLFTDEVAARANVPFDRARVILHTLLAAEKVDRVSVEYDNLPIHVRINVKPGMSRFRWGLR